MQVNPANLLFPAPDTSPRLWSSICWPAPRMTRNSPKTPSFASHNCRRVQERASCAGRYFAIENRVHVHDLHATMLHLLVLDHKKLTFHFSGRDMRLTGVHGEVIYDLLA